MCKNQSYVDSRAVVILGNETFPLFFLVILSTNLKDVGISPMITLCHSDIYGALR